MEEGLVGCWLPGCMAGNARVHEKELPCVLGAFKAFPATALVGRLINFCGEMYGH